MNNTPEIVKEGWLKRVKNQKKRYFVLCFNKDSGAAQLQYYESEKKFHSKSEPKRTIYLRDCLGIIGRVDPKEGHVLVLYTKEDVFSVTTETNESLESWLNDLDKLHKMENKNLQDSKYDLVWNVTVIPRGLGGVKNMTGAYKLCLNNETLYFVNPVSQEVMNEEKLCYIRRYGHMDYCFFMEFGRSTTLGAGEIWMEVEDPLIAQKIHETLSRSVKPPTSTVSGDHAEPKKTRNNKHNRHSMVHVDPKSYLVDSMNNNNHPSPRTTRRSFLNVFTKKTKDIARPHSKSMSADSSPKHEHVTKNLSKNSPYMNESARDGEHSDEEAYPLITPPIPSVPRRSSKTPLPAIPNEDVPQKNDKKSATGPETKSLTETSVDIAKGNDYAMFKPKRRSVMKQDCSAVRQGYAEQRRSRSLPRRSSSTSIERQRIGSNMSTDSEKDCCFTSDDDERRHSLDHPQDHYMNMSPSRAPITSDSSFEDQAPYPPHRQSDVPPRQSDGSPRCQSDGPDQYIQMHSPRHTPHPKRYSTSSARSSDSTEEPAMLDSSGQSPYMNMSPDEERPWSVKSDEDGLSTMDNNEEAFDHLHRDETVSGDKYVSMSAPSTDSGKPRKGRAESQRCTPSSSDYVNVNINRSRSVGNKTTPRPVFEIVSEQHDRPSSSDDETIRHPAASYVNTRMKNAGDSSSDPSLHYAKYAPPRPDSRESSKLNYASVAFSEDQTSKTTNGGAHRTSFLGKESNSNYSTIDFTKSKGLEEMSSSRELQLQQGIH